MADYWAQTQSDRVMKMSKTEYLKTGLKTVCGIAILCYFIVILFSVLLLFPSLILVLPELFKSSWTFFIITPYMIPVFCFKGLNLAIYYLFVVSAILLSFSYMVKKEGKQALFLYSKFFENKKKSISFFQNPIRRKFFENKRRNALFFQNPMRRKNFLLPEENNNSFFLIPQIFLGLIFFDYAYSYIIEFTHVTPKTPSFGNMPVWELMFSLSNAPVHEEIVSRIILIGLPLLFINLFRGRRIKVRKYFFGGGFDIDPVSLFLIIFSSLIFSYAHVFGWDFYKILPVFVTGLALGYLFLKKGVYACIILHFSFDYPSVLLKVFEKLPEMNMITVPVLFFLSVLIVSWFVACPFYFVKYVYKIIKNIPTIFKPN